MSGIKEWFSSWKLLSWRTAVVVAFVVYTLFGFLAVPWIAERIIVDTVQERLGREVAVEEIRCNPFALSLTVRGFTLPDRPGSTVLSFDELYANLQASSLLRWALTLKELRIDGLHAALRRFEDGEINVLELKKALDASKTSDEPFELPRAHLQLIELNRGRIDLEDQAREEPARWTWDPVEVTLTDISTIPDRQGDNDLVIGLATGGTLRVRGDVIVEPLGLDGAVDFEQFSLPNTWKLVEEKFQLAVSDGMVSGGFSYRADLQDDGLHVEVSDGQFAVDDFVVETSDSESELVRASSVSVAGVTARWPEQAVSGDSLTIDGAYAHVWLEPDGTPSWDVLVPRSTQEEIVEAYRYVEERFEIDGRLARFEVKNASALFEDRRFDDPLSLEVAEADLVLTDVSTEPESVWGLTAAAAIGEGSRASADGTLVALPLKLEAEVELAGLELSQFQRYVAEVAPVELRAGVLETKGRARLAPRDESGKIAFNGDLAVHGLDMDEMVTGGTLLGWGDLTVTGIQAALAPTSLEVEKADVHSAGLEIAVAEDGSINLLEFFKALGEEEGTGVGGAVEAEEASTRSGLPPAHIARLELHDCYGRYTDATTIEPFERRIEAVNGTISNISTDTTAGADLAIDAAVDSGGVVHLTGELDPFDYARLTDLDIDIRDVGLPPMSPMSIKLIGFPIEEGTSQLDLSYEIHDQKLVSTNHVEIDDLKLGERVPGEAKIKAPVKLGVSLLKDAEGRITLDIPIEGDLGNPEFVMVSAVQSAVTELISEIAKAPFRVLGRLAGGSDEEDLEHVEFAAGSAELGEPARTDLGTLSRALAQRPSLRLDIEGTVDVEADGQALRKESLVASLGGEASFEKIQSSHPIAELEALARTQAGDGAVDALRAQHTADSPEASLDEVAYRKALVDALLAEQVIEAGAIEALGPARAAAIQAFLVDTQGIEASRVTLLPDTASVESSGEWVACKLAVDAGG